MRQLFTFFFFPSYLLFNVGRALQARLSGCIFCRKHVTDNKCSGQKDTPTIRRALCFAYGQADTKLELEFENSLQQIEQFITSKLMEHLKEAL